MSELIGTINAIAWGPLMLLLLLGTGIYLTFGLGFLTLRRLPTGFAMLLRGRRGTGSGDISTPKPPFSALMTSLSATIGTGNIAGVATALALGGPGALFWMWITALFGMATKYAEAVCAVHFREQDSEGNFSGGPMYYIRNGLKKHWHFLAFAFAIFGSLAGFGIANTVQSNSISQVLKDGFGVAPLLTGVVLMVLVGAVVLGGIRRISTVASYLVPLMAGSYLLMGLIVIATHIGEVPAAVNIIVSSAFTGSAAMGGFAGATIRFGVARGIFSNEAGLGSAPIAHAAAQTKEPVEQGLIAMLGTFIDTIVICTMTALVILTVRGDFVHEGQAVLHAWQSDRVGFEMTSGAFAAAFPAMLGSIPIGTLVASIVLILFVFTTLLTWSYYGERAITFIYDRVSKSATRANEKKLHVAWRILWCVVIFIGAAQPSELVWRLGDISNATMLLPNILALALLSGVVFKLSRGEKEAGPTHEADAPPAEVEAEV